MTNQTDRQYVNLLVFAIIAGIVSVVLMVVVISIGATSELIQQLKPLIITIEVGLLLIISFTIYKSVRHIMRLNDMRDNIYDTKLQITTCPDYWTLKSHDGNGNRVCINTFQHPDDPKVSYVIAGSHNSLSSEREVRLSDYDDKTVREVCDRIKTDIKSPWHSIDSLCDQSG